MHHYDVRKVDRPPKTWALVNTMKITSARTVKAPRGALTVFQCIVEGYFLCGPLRISASSALETYLTAETQRDAEDRREKQSFRV
jgi:hypothetical protein